MKYLLQIPGKLTIGGAEKVARDIGLYADPAEYEVHYVVFGDDIGEYEQELMDHGCKIYHWPQPAKNYYGYLCSLLRLMKQYPYSAVHVHTMFNAGWVMLAAKLSGVPVRIAHAHSALTNGASTKKQFYESFMRHLILRCSTDLVCCGNAAGERLFGKRAFQERSQLILNGVNVSSYAFSLSARVRIRSELGLGHAFVIGHVGHLAQVKNQKFLIELLPKILLRKPNAVLLMLGEGQDRAMLEERIRDLGLSDRVIMTGNVRNVPDYLSAMDVFAFPSLYEGMPLSIVEVQANGLPCVLSTGVPRDVYLTDLIQPLPLDHLELWVDSICDSERRESRKYAEELKHSGFNSSEIMKKYYDLYERADRN